MKGTATSYNFNFGKEFLIGDRGNLILEPRIGLGWSKYKFKYDNLVSDSVENIVPNDEIRNLYTLKSRTINSAVFAGCKKISPTIIFLSITSGVLLVSSIFTLNAYKPCLC